MSQKDDMKANAVESKELIAELEVTVAKLVQQIDGLS